MNESDLREWVANRLGLEEVPEPLWEDLVRDEYVKFAVERGQAERGDLLRVARDRLRLHRRLKSSEGRRMPVEVATKPKTDPGFYTNERALATAEAVADQAMSEDKVQQFRKRYLDGGPLSLPDAHRLLHSPAAALLSAGELGELGIPIVGHESTVRDYQERPNEGFVRVEVSLEIEWSGKRQQVKRDWNWRDDDDRRHLDLAAIDATGPNLEIEVWPLAVLDHLRVLSEWLAKWYDWDVGQAAWFVLTSTPPRHEPLEADVSVQFFPSHTRGRVTISVEPWVPADVVEQTYRSIQRDLLGRENRPLSVRNLMLLRAVLKAERDAERADTEGSHLSRAAVMQQWNAEHPEQHYQQRWRFERDIDRARTAVLFPEYQLAPQAEERDEGDLA
jgi:hypothetical protein